MDKFSKVLGSVIPNSASENVPPPQEDWDAVRLGLLHSAGLAVPEDRPAQTEVLGRGLLSAGLGRRWIPPKLKFVPHSGGGVRETDTR